MQKLVVGIIAILCVHIGFVAYFSTPDTAESARIRESQTRPIPMAPSEPVLDDQIIVARGTMPDAAIDTPAAAVTVVSTKNTVPHSALQVERTTVDFAPRPVRSVKIIPSRSVPLYQNAKFIVARTEFPANMRFIAPPAESNPGYYAKTEPATQKGKRSFLSKVGSIVKKPYDGLKAVASWLR